MDNDITIMLISGILIMTTIIVIIVTKVLSITIRKQLYQYTFNQLLTIHVNTAAIISRTMVFNQSRYLLKQVTWMFKQITSPFKSQNEQ